MQDLVVQMKNIKRLIFIVFLFFNLNIIAQNIGYVNSKYRTNIIYDRSGHRLFSIDYNIGQVIGYSSKYVIVNSKNYYYIYNSKGRKIHGLSKSSIGNIVGMNDNTFISIKGSYMYLWNMDGKKLESKSIR